MPPVPHHQASPTSQLPWQVVTAEAGLRLAAPIALELDMPALREDLDRMLAAVPAGDRMHRTGDGTWSGIPLVEQPRFAPSEPVPGIPTPAWRHMPATATLLEKLELPVHRAWAMRMEPGGVVDWHYDPLAAHLDTARLILPLVTTEGAVTWIGHEGWEFQPDAIWYGDFTFPHKVTNGPAGERIVLGIDVICDSNLFRLLPPDLLADIPHRIALSQAATGMLLAAR